MARRNKAEEIAGNVAFDIQQMAARPSKSMRFGKNDTERLEAFRTMDNIQLIDEGALWLAKLKGVDPEPDPVPGTPVDMRELITERAAFARTLAEDGAYFDAARVLQRLAADVLAHAARKRAELEALVNGNR